MPTAFSAPGKVFLAGGYLVLDRRHTALVFSLSARIHVVVAEDEQQDDQTPSAGQLLVRVRSPQFREAVWVYRCELGAGDGGVGGVVVTQIQEGPSTSRNPFVETALAYALTYARNTVGDDKLPRRLAITILADDDYYSHGSDAESTAPTTFSDFDVTLGDAHKTGLGSSAALVTSLCGALLAHLLPASAFELSSDTSRAHLHNLAQIAHCAAQGKVGSGFDIATAVYGTCIYRRFSPSLFEHLGEPGSASFAGKLTALVRNDPSLAMPWDTEVTKNVVLPAGLALVMCDVDCGSQTVSMVKSVLAWRAQHPTDALALWTELQTANETLATHLAHADMTLPADRAALTAALAHIRSLIRDMSARSAVPIEPPSQTALLDAATAAVDGVMGGVVPGAGGYDAITLLVRTDDDGKSINELRRFLASWADEGKGKVRLLGTRGEIEGARIEGDGTSERYSGWL